MTRVRIRAAARRDLIEHYVHLYEAAGSATADRFLQAAETSFERLVTQPLMGAALPTRRPDLDGVRKWAVSGFDDVLIFYHPRRDGISVIRVLHGSRDWWRLMDLSSD